MSARVPALAVWLGVLLAAANASGQGSNCTAPEATIRLDHAIVVVRDLDSAAVRFARLGFRFKPGRLHPDSLRNHHIKFRDGTELELMTVVGTPTSRMARDYAALLAAGEGGAYAALVTTDMARVRSAAKRLGAPRLTRLGAWQFLSLPGVFDTHAIFFWAGATPVRDPDSVLDHPNGSVSLAAAWVEGGPALDQLLLALGSRPCGTIALPNGRQGTRWALARGSLVVSRGPTRRLVGVEVERRGAENPQLREPVPGFWLWLRRD